MAFDLDISRAGSLPGHFLGHIGRSYQGHRSKFTVTGMKNVPSSAIDAVD